MIRRLKHTLLHIVYMEGQRPAGCTCPRLPWQYKPSCRYHVDQWVKERIDARPH